MPAKNALPKCRRCHSSIAHPIAKKDAGEWLVCCLACGVVLCEECCLSPETGYCNRHIHHFYNFPENDFTERQQGG